MTQPGLALVSPELVDMLRQSSEDTRHRIVERVCKLAVQRADVPDPKLMAALDMIHQGRYGDPDLGRQLDALTQGLDEIAWGIQDQVEAGNAAQDEYFRAFAKARAAAAIKFALVGSLAASFDSFYEAYHAINNRDDFMRAVAE